MYPDEMSVRPVVDSHAVRPVPREASPRHSTAQQARPQAPAPTEEPETAEEQVATPEEPQHLIDLRV